MQQSSEVLFGSQPNPVSLSFGSQHSPIPTPAVRCATELSFVCVNETVIFSSHKGGYNPAHSTTSADALTDFLNSSVQEDLVSIPGIGEVNKAILVADMNSHNLPVESIQTTFQLIAKFLSLKGPGVTSVEHCDRFYYWLQSKGITSHRAAIVEAIAQRCNIMIPNIYDASAYGPPHLSQPIPFA